MPARFGGVAVDEPKSRFGGVPIEETKPVAAEPKTAPKSVFDVGPAEPSAADLDAFMKQRYSGPSATRRRSLDHGLTPMQVYQRSRGVKEFARDYSGLPELSTGIHQVGQGEFKKGAHNLIVGGGKLTAPVALPPAVAFAPIPTAIGMGMGAAGGAAAKKVAEVVGAGEDTANLAGDIGGIVAGGLAGAPGRLGNATRAGLRQVAKELPGAGKVGRIVEAVRGAWNGAKAGVPDNTSPVPNAAPTPASGPKPAPSAASGADAGLLDDIATSLAGKKYAKLTPEEQNTVQQIATRGQTKPVPSPGRPASPGPGRDTSPVAAPGSVAPRSTSDASPAAPPVQSAPSNEVGKQELPPQQAPAAAHPQDVAATVARDLVQKGFTPDDLVALTAEQRAEALGEEAGRFTEILREMRSHGARKTMDTARTNKDSAMARFFQARGISPEQVAAMDEGTLGTHITSAGYKPPVRAGSLGRSHSQVRHDIVEAMKAAPKPASAPGGPAPGTK